ncbi:hypothetical protein Q31b_50990 [Novipirellula aureliae]|uniref:Uncharacterized protein n=1 Tax=Novipirellula aureliae TaxID=2527966 RepID=A0A5C6DHZ1_9BACT|nr:hypothetical protein Q31b_50990 [Novipirellula aureliae]
MLDVRAAAATLRAPVIERYLRDTYVEAELTNSDVEAIESSEPIVPSLGGIGLRHRISRLRNVAKPITLTLASTMVLVAPTSGLCFIRHRNLLSMRRCHLGPIANRLDASIAMLRFDELYP